MQEQLPLKQHLEGGLYTRELFMQKRNGDCKYDTQTRPSLFCVKRSGILLG